MSQQRERALIGAYIRERWPARRVILGCPLGPVPLTLVATWGRIKAARLARGIRPEVDALVFDDHRLVIIEAKIVKWLDGLAKLPLYKGLVATTPELLEYLDWPVDMVLCTPWANESIDAAAAAQGVRVDVFSTPEVEVYAQELGKYWTKEYRERRQERKLALERLGLE